MTLLKVSLLSLQASMFAKSGEFLTLRLRKMAFEAMLRQVSKLFEKKEDSRYVSVQLSFQGN